jgi:ATP/maltotriose-dependent transcriptional regulator MalT
LCQQAGLAGRLGEAIEEAQEAVEVAREQGDRGLLGVALTELGAVKLLDSQLDGRHELHEALAIEQDLGGLPARVYQSPRIWQAIEMTFGDDPRGARALFEERLAIDMERGDEVSSFQSIPILVLAELFSDDWTAARHAARATLDRVEGLGYEYARPIVLGSVASVEAYQGNLTEARAIGTEALSTLTALGDRFFTTFVLASLVFTELCAGNASAALAHATEIDERFSGRECWWSYHQGDAIEALVLVGAHRRALARAATLRRWGNELSLSRFLAWADRGEALVRAVDGDLAGAEGALESALRHHERYVVRFERARTLLAYGHVLRRLRRRREARAALDEALAHFDGLGARHFAGVVRAELKQVGGRPPAGEHELTGAEDRIARLVAAGRSNKEAAAELFVTVSTDLVARGIDAGWLTTVSRGSEDSVCAEQREECWAKSRRVHLRAE